jgi:hypothetical protein
LLCGMRCGDVMPPNGSVSPSHHTLLEWAQLQPVQIPGLYIHASDQIPHDAH